MDVTVDYDSKNFISQRDKLEANFIKYLQKKFDEQTKGLVKVASLHVLNLEFVKEFEAAVTKKLLESVETKITDLGKNASIIRQNILKNEKLTDAKIYLTNAEIQAYEKEQFKTAQGEALKTLITADADAYKSVDDKFGFSLDNNLINFILSIEQGSFTASQKVGYTNAEISVKKDS